jgi:hypothetical protein
VRPAAAGRSGADVYTARVARWCDASWLTPGQVQRQCVCPERELPRWRKEQG